MRLTIAQVPPFVQDWRRLGLTDEDLQALERLLLEKPDRGAVIPGAGGVRKLRFAPPSWHTGKRGAARVIYAYFPWASWVWLFLMYGKNVQGNLTPAEAKAVARLAADIDAEMKRKASKGRL
jgi:hypothetical protein